MFPKDATPPDVPEPRKLRLLLRKLLILIPAYVLGEKAMDAALHAYLLSWGKLLASCFGVAIILIAVIWCAPTSRRIRDENRRLGKRRHYVLGWICGSFVLTMALYGAAAQINKESESAPVTYQQLRIVAKQHWSFLGVPHYSVTTIVDAGRPVSYDVPVDAATYAVAKPDDPVLLGLRKGNLSVPYVCCTTVGAKLQTITLPRPQLPVRHLTDMISTDPGDTITVPTIGGIEIATPALESYLYGPPQCYFMLGGPGTSVSLWGRLVFVPADVKVLRPRWRFTALPDLCLEGSNGAPDQILRDQRIEVEITAEETARYAAVNGQIVHLAGILKAPVDTNSGELILADPKP